MSKASICGYSVKEMELLLTVMDRALVTGEISNQPPYPSTLDVTFDIVGAAVACPPERSDLSPQQVGVVIDALWNVLHGVSTLATTGNATNRRVQATKVEGGHPAGLVHYQQAQLWAAKMVIATLNNTDGSSLSVVGTRTGTKLELRRSETAAVQRERGQF